MTPASNEIIRVGQITVNFLLEGQQTDGQMAMFEFTVPPGAKVPVPHYHEKYDETIYGLEGIMTFTVNGEGINIGQGQTCFIPRGATHGFNNLGQQEAKALAVITPGLLGPEFFREIASMLNAGGPPDPEKIKEVYRRHGLVPVAPKG